jgi:hypothetical protein
LGGVLYTTLNIISQQKHKQVQVFFYGSLNLEPTLTGLKIIFLFIVNTNKNYTLKFPEMYTVKSLDLSRKSITKSNLSLFKKKR